MFLLLNLCESIFLSGKLLWYSGDFEVTVPKVTNHVTALQEQGL